MDEKLWYKDAIIYEVHVRAFQDGNNDGIGDFIGLTQRLEYLADLGVTAVWLLPFTRSPLKDDGYDIADYTSVHPNYGTLKDFKAFLEKAHSLGIRVITELVINHTSDQHPWFQRARHAPVDSPERNFYVWSDNPEKYAGVPLMFPDFESSNWAWDPIARQYYWHRFYSHQPDLNFDNPAVWEALLPVVDFWFELGVDGMRLDAVPYLFEREGTTCEHLPETHEFLKALRKHVDERFPNRMFLAEANAWPDNMVEYFGKGDECQMAFHFPLMPRLFMALHQEDRFPIADILEQTPDIPDECQWCLFLRNHDELTLAMITDEERDAMYSAYARDRQARLFLGIRHRLAPLLRNDRRRIELMNAILFSLPGTPVLYYGDEIGMGDNIYLGDRNGVRTPMQWSADRNAGFSRANAQRLYLPVIIDSEYHYEATNVETQQGNPSSLLWWTKRLIALRKRHPAFGRGTIELLEPENSKILAYIREDASEKLLVVANLSRFVQNVRLDLTKFAGLVPEELSGRTRFPVIKRDETYGLTLGPHGFYWFSLVPELTDRQQSSELPVVEPLAWSNLIHRTGWEILSNVLIERHNAGLRPQIVGCRLMEEKLLPIDGLDSHLLTCRLEYANGQFELLFQPLTIVPASRFEGQELLPSATAFLRSDGANAQVLVDPIGLPEYITSLLEAVAEGATLPLTGGGELRCTAYKNLHDLRPSELAELAQPVIFSGARSHLTVVIDRRMVLRVYRRPGEGLNPDVEVGRFLQESGFTQFANLLGTIEYIRDGNEPTTLAALHEFVPHQGDAWQLMLDQAGRFYEGVAAQCGSGADFPVLLPSEQSPESESGERWEHLVSPFLHSARDLAEVVAQLHLTLAREDTHDQFAPVAVTGLHQRSFYQTLRNAAGRLNALLRDSNFTVNSAVVELASEVRALYPQILDFIRAALEPGLADGLRIRCHGDLHLGQFLVSGQDFILTDFEGAPDRPVSERRIKRSPMIDVASLLRSFDYVAHAVRLELMDKPGVKQSVVRHEDRVLLEPYAVAWLQRIEAEFLTVYSELTDSAGLLPKQPAARKLLLEMALLERVFREAEFDLRYRPEWAVISLAALIRIVRRDEDAKGEYVK